MKAKTIVTQNALKIFISLAAYFFLMQLLGFEDDGFLRFFNVIVLYYFVNATVKKLLEDQSNNFMVITSHSLIVGAAGVLLSIVAFSFYIRLFMGETYLSQLGSPFIPLGDSSSLMQYSFALLVEGMCSALIVSMYVLMRWKNKIGTIESKI